MVTMAAGRTVIIWRRSIGGKRNWLVRRIEDIGLGWRHRGAAALGLWSISFRNEPVPLTNDERGHSLTKCYLKIICFTYSSLRSPISQAVMRSWNRCADWLCISLARLLFSSTTLNYLLIYGHWASHGWGVPALRLRRCSTGRLVLGGGPLVQLGGQEGVLPLAGFFAG
jgi:hypothetical protein